MKRHTQHPVTHTWQAIILKIAVLSIFLILADSRTSIAQTADDFKIAAKVLTPVDVAKPQRLQKGQKNVVKATVSALFVFYKNYISSQDGSHCSFYPSCSSYALQSIRKKGLIEGMLSTFDRLSRCNGMSAEKYPVKKGTNLLYDPVE